MECLDLCPAETATGGGFSLATGDNPSGTCSQILANAIMALGREQLGQLADPEQTADFVERFEYDASSGLCLAQEEHSRSSSHRQLET